MTIVIATEAAKVRRACGSPGTTQLPEADLQAFITEDALDWLNDRRPGENIDSFVTVAGRQEYDVMPSGSLRVKKAWWMDANWVTVSNDLRMVSNAVDMDDQMAGLSVIDNPSLVTIFYKKIVSYADSFRGAAEETSEGLVRLMPAPTSAGDTVFFHYTFARAAITVTADKYVPAVRHYATHLALDYLAQKRTVVVSGRNWSGGGGRIERDRSVEFLEKAEAIAPVPPLISMG